jgi:hypothetical protein
MKKFKHQAVALGIAMAISGTAYADLNDGLVAYYPFDGNANDESGNGNHGVEYGETHYTNGMIKQARLFDREDGLEYILIPNTLNSNEYSVALWANLEDISSLHSLLMLNSTSYWAGADFWLFMSSERVAVIQNQNDLREDSYNSTFMSSNRLESHTNYFIVANFQNQRMTLYVNGEFYAEYGGVAPIQNNPTNLNIGISPSGTGQYQINGLIDDLRIYNRALSDSEIDELYQIGSEPTKTYEDGLKEGIAKCQNDPSSCGITVPPESGNCPRVDTHASFTPSDGILTIPAVDVPDIFGGVRTYRAEMSLNPGDGLVFSVTTAEPIE